MSYQGQCQGHCRGHCNLIDEPVSGGSATAGRASPVGTVERGVTLKTCKSEDSLAVKYRRMKCAVIVMATLMIMASMLLVGVSLAMAEHIDELGKLFISCRCSVM